MAHKKTRLILQHLVGLKTDDKMFTNEEINKYDTISYYDDDEKTLSMMKDSNNLFSVLLDNSDDIVKDNIRNTIKTSDNKIIIRRVTHNKVNIFDDNEVKIEFSHIKKTFESFNYSNWRILPKMKT